MTRTAFFVLAIAISYLAPLAPLASASSDTIVFSDSFPSAATGWNATGLWNLSTRAAASAPYSWHYGIERTDGTSTYDTGSPNRGDLISPPIDLSGLARAKASFWTRWTSEGGCSFEHPMIYAQDEAGARTLVREMCDATARGPFEANLTAFVGTTIRLVFHWDTLDGYANDFEGWYVDDVAVSEADANEDVTLPDLAIGALWTSPQPTAGSPATIHAAVHNAGNAPLRASANVALSLDGSVFATRAVVAGLAPGATVEVNATLRMPGSGRHAIAVVADPAQAIAELDETNNARSIGIDVGASVVDLGVAWIRVPGFIEAGRPFNATARVGILGNDTTLGSFAYQWTLDHATLDAGTAASGAGGDRVFNDTIPGLAPGLHELGLALDPNDEISEMNATNDSLAIRFVVQPPARVSVAIPDLHRVTIQTAQTDAGDLAHPLARYQATLRTCDAGPGPTPGGAVAIWLAATVGSTDLAPRALQPLDASQCSDDTFEFDAPGAIGDFTLHAQLAAENDISRDDDNASASSFHGVGGAGGVVLPGGAGAPLTPDRPLDPLTDNATKVQATANATVDQAQAFLAGRPTATILQIARENVTANPTTGPDTNGRPGLGNADPCGANEPDPSKGFPQWIAWYAVHVADRGDLFVPSRERPAGQRWPLPDVPLAPGLGHGPCDDLWDDAAEADAVSPV